MVEERLLGGERHHRDDGCSAVVQPIGLSGQVPRLHRDILSGGTVAVPIRQAVDRIAYRDTGGPVAEGGNDARYLVAGDHRATIMPRAIDPRRRPVELRGREAGGVNTDQRIANAGRRDRRFLLDQMLGSPPLVGSQCTHSEIQLVARAIHVKADSRRLVRAA